MRLSTRALRPYYRLAFCHFLLRSFLHWLYILWIVESNTEVIHMGYLFMSALGAWRAFGQWFLTSDNLSVLLGIGIIICAVAFAYALTHKSTL